MQISNAIHNALNNYNDSVNTFSALEDALFALEPIRSALERHINNADVPFDILKVIRYFHYAKEQAMRYIQSYFIFKEAEADLNRYTWDSELYNKVREYQNFKVPQFLKEAKKSLSFRQAFKNKIHKKCACRSPAN
jgi:hypothetical protein